MLLSDSHTRVLKYGLAFEIREPVCSQTRFIPTYYSRMYQYKNINVSQNVSADTRSHEQGGTHKGYV
jgi:hypothetical protein